jgi:hypothetical protein
VVRALSVLSDEACGILEEVTRLAETRMHQRGQMSYLWGGVYEQTREMLAKISEIFEVQKGAPGNTKAPAEP